MAGGGGMGEVIIFITHPYPLLLFDCHSPPWYKFVSLPSLPLLLKFGMVAIIFTENLRNIMDYTCLQMTLGKKPAKSVCWFVVTLRVL